MAATKTSSGPEVGRPQPQSTTEPGGGPFIRHSQPGNLAQYVASAVAFGGLIQQPIVARAGYYRDFRILFTASGGVNGTNTVAASADAPYNVASLIQFKDPFGTLIFSLPSYEALLVNMHSGGAGCGIANQAAPLNLPSFTAVSTGSAGTGNFQWALALPLEFAKGIGTMPGANASLQPNLQMQLNASAQLYTTAPGTLPTIQAAVEGEFYWLPEGTDISPPSIGTSQQWIFQQANPVITTGGNQRVAFPRLGGFLSTLIIEIRDSTGARIDAFPSSFNRQQLIIDGVPIDDSPFWKLMDDYAITFSGITRPTGVFVYSRRTSLNQRSEGLLDTGEAGLSTNPGTLIELMASPWGTVTNSPGTINVIIGQIVPRGRMVQGLPEV